MSDAYRLHDKIGSDGSEATAAYQGIVAKPARRCVAVPPGSTTHINAELSCLLRRRLRIAGLIGLGGFGLFFLKGLTLVKSADGPTGLGLGLHAGVVAVLIMGCSLLWSRIFLSWRALRAIELTMFGAMGIFFTYLQITIFGGGTLLEWAKPDYVEKVLAMGTSANSMRWFILIVLYGTFIPNTWKRCALVVGCMMGVPLLLGIWSYQCPYMCDHASFALYDMAIILGLGAAIAIFGSYRISELQQQAFEARRMGQYVLRERLGKGGMGEVYLGEHLLLRRACAIKLIRPDQAGDPTNLSRFEREVQAMAGLTHWNTVEVYDYGHNDDGTFYYVMEYLPGLSLQELVDRHGPLSPGRAIHFLRQLCAALREAHGVGLIHRDIKPSNVIASQRGGVHDVAKLLDFGLVQGIGLQAESDKLTIQGSILGSPPYISPEQALGKSQVDPRTDIYSLGGLAYFLVTGQAPFLRETAMELLMAHVHDRVLPPRELRPDLPSDLEEVILRCLSKSPNARYAEIQDLDDALADCADAKEWDHEQATHWWNEQGSARQPALVG